MTKDVHLYAFIVSKTSRSRSQIRQFCFHQRWLKLSAVLVAGLVCAAGYGFYNLTQEASRSYIQHENQRLKVENAKQRQQLEHLNQRVEAIEDTSRRIAEMSGVEHDQDLPRPAGGPFVAMDTVSEIEFKTEHLERDFSEYEQALRERVTPSIWPVAGNLTDGFGGRRNPFGGFATEFHTGQDIATNFGTPVAVTANGTVTFTGWQNGYGNLVIVDHGDGLTTRYGHLSKILVDLGQTVSKGDLVGNVGSTGRSTGPHLHYEVRINDEPVDPLEYLPE